VAEQVGIPLVRTKLEPPVPREAVARPELVDALARGESRRLTVVRAPAGWGKTTLLAGWFRAERDRRPAAWLTLDPSDGDPGRFWAYLLAVLRSLSPGVGEGSSRLLLAPGVDLLKELLPALLDELGQLPPSALLVLDDYHLVRNLQIHEGMAYLIDHMPPTLRLVVASRSEPPFPLARLRARGELAEIDTRQLGFSRQETDALVNGIHGLGIQAADVERLWERTEGWAAGLYLAVLSLGHQPDRHQFIATFAGDDRHVVDFLGAEVLAEQPAATRTFLLRTAILDRFCGLLCAAVAGDADAARTLAQIEQSNAFLIALDTRREWYRYHHLFKELLRHELSLVEPKRLPDLHRRAAAWLVEAGLVSDAIHHLAAGGDVEAAGELIAQHWAPFTNLGNRTTAEGWLDALPERSVLADARLCLARAWISFSGGRLDEVLPWTEAAEQAGPPAPFRDGVTSVASGAATLRASYHLLLGDSARARTFAAEALGLERTPPWRAIAYNCLGTASYWLGATEEAVELLEETVRTGRAEGPNVAGFALGHLAVIAAEEGDRARAVALVNEAQALIERSGTSEYWTAAGSHLASARMLEQDGTLREAERELARGVDLARRGAPRVLLGYGLLGLARVRRALGQEDAQALVAEARRIIESCPDPGERALELLAEAPRQPRRRPAVGGEELSEREQTVLRLLASELSQREIGRELGLSLNTVKSHARAIFRKLDVEGRPEAVQRARELGLL
jgi:LuxR family transcriptional regulator, maltose regulon positive regulatory protein